jgi:hypothetical protein
MPKMAHFLVLKSYNKWSEMADDLPKNVFVLEPKIQDVPKGVGGSKIIKCRFFCQP